MNKFSKANMCITDNFSFKVARNETGLKTDISVPKRRVRNNTKYNMVLCILEVGGGVEHSNFIATLLIHISTRLLMQNSSHIYCLPQK